MTTLTEYGNYNLYVNDTFQGRTPGRVLATSTESTEIAEDHLAGRSVVVLAGAYRVGGAEPAESRARDPRHRHLSRRNGEHNRYPVASLNRPSGS